MNTEERFLKAVKENYQKAMQQNVRISPRELAELKNGTFLKNVRDRTTKNRVSDSFDTLSEAGLLQWSVEALVTDSRFGALFTDAQADFCLQVLLDEGFYGTVPGKG